MTGKKKPLTIKVETTTLQPAKTLSPDAISRILFGCSTGQVAKEMSRNKNHPLLRSVDENPGEL